MLVLGAGRALETICCTIARPRPHSFLIKFAMICLLVVQQSVPSCNENTDRDCSRVVFLRGEADGYFFG